MAFGTYCFKQLFLHLLISQTKGNISRRKEKQAMFGVGKKEVSLKPGMESIKPQVRNSNLIGLSWGRNHQESLSRAMMYLFIVMLQKKCHLRMYVNVLKSHKTKKRKYYYHLLPIAFWNAHVKKDKDPKFLYHVMHSVSQPRIISVH